LPDLSDILFLAAPSYSNELSEAIRLRREKEGKMREMERRKRLEDEFARVAGLIETPETKEEDVRREMLGSLLRYATPEEAVEFMEKGRGDKADGLGKLSGHYRSFIDQQARGTLPPHVVNFQDYLKWIETGAALGKVGEGVAGGKAAVVSAEEEARLKKKTELEPELERRKAEYAARGKAAGELGAPLSQKGIKVAITQAEEAIDLVDKMLSHEGFKGAVGQKDWSSGFGLREEPFAGTPASGFVSIYNQLAGQAFLDAFQALKGGGGAISDIEGKKAVQARNRMDRATSEKDFISAARDFQKSLGKMIEANKALLSEPGKKPSGSRPTRVFKDGKWQTVD
jgi:hypothetical protein